MFALIYDMEKKQAILKEYEDVADYVADFSKREWNFNNIMEVHVGGIPLQKVEMLGYEKLVKILSDNIHCELGGATIIDGKVYRTLVCKAKEG